MEIIDPQKIEVLKEIVEFLYNNNIHYHITGGLAGNIYGSSWPLNDIDIDVEKPSLEIIRNHFKDHIFEDLEYLEDNLEFKCWFMSLKINNVIVEFTAVEEFYVKTKDEWLKIEFNLKKASWFTWNGVKLKVQPLEDIIQYKKLIGRKKDVEDLENFKI